MFGGKGPELLASHIAKKIVPWPSFKLCWLRVYTAEEGKRGTWMCWTGFGSWRQSTDSWCLQKELLIPIADVNNSNLCVVYWDTSPLLKLKWEGMTRLFRCRRRGESFFLWNTRLCKLLLSIWLLVRALTLRISLVTHYVAVGKPIWQCTAHP